jgi:hypothetical protein
MNEERFATMAATALRTLMGAFTFARAAKALSPRAVLVSCLVTVWALRLQCVIGPILMSALLIRGPTPAERKMLGEDQLTH